MKERITSSSQCPATSAKRQAVVPTGFTQSCLDSATLCDSSLRSVWSEVRLTYISPSTVKTRVSTSPDEFGPTA